MAAMPGAYTARMKSGLVPLTGPNTASTWLVKRIINASRPQASPKALSEDVQAMALRNAYAIDMPAPDTLTRRRERIAGIHGLSIDTIELYERNMIDELALRLVHGELPVGR